VSCATVAFDNSNCCLGSTDSGQRSWSVVHIHHACTVLAIAKSFFCSAIGLQWTGSVKSACSRLVTSICRSDSWQRCVFRFWPDSHNCTRWPGWAAVCVHSGCCSETYDVTLSCNLCWPDCCVHLIFITTKWQIHGEAHSVSVDVSMTNDLTLTWWQEVICSNAEVKGALLACQKADILHCYIMVVKIAHTMIL